MIVSGGLDLPLVCLRRVEKEERAEFSILFSCASLYVNE